MGVQTIDRLEDERRYFTDQLVCDRTGVVGVVGVPSPPSHQNTRLTLVIASPMVRKRRVF